MTIYLDVCVFKYSTNDVNVANEALKKCKDCKGYDRLCPYYFKVRVHRREALKLYKQGKVTLDEIVKEET